MGIWDRDIQLACRGCEGSIWADLTPVNEDLNEDNEAGDVYYYICIMSSINRANHQLQLRFRFLAPAKPE